MNRYWLLVLIASILEIAWAMLLKAADNFQLWLLAFALIVLTSVFILKANNHLPVGTVYATFTGIGAGGSVIAGILIFGEPVSVVKILLICLLLSGVLGLKLITDKDTADGARVVSVAAGQKTSAAHKQMPRQTHEQTHEQKEKAE